MMLSATPVLRSIACVSGAALACAGSASATTWISASDPFVSITADAGPYHGTFSVPLSAAGELHDPDPMSGGDLWGWTATANTPIMDGSHLVAILVSMNVLAARLPVYDDFGDPTGQFRWGISMQYSVQAGLDATTFTLASPTLSFDPLTNVYGTAGGTFGGTSQPNAGGVYDGMTLGPALPSGRAFETLFNGSSLFRDYFTATLGAVGSGSVNTHGNMPVPGVDEFVGDPVTSMQSRVSFSLTALDTAGGTTDYSIIPAPGAAALLGLVGLVGLRRRR